MALTLSTMIELGSVAPNFSLQDVISNKLVSLSDFKESKAMLVMFISQHCPYVKHIEYELAKIGKDYSNKDLGIVAICSNDIINYPDDSPENLREMAVRLGFNFPYCYDETQEVAKSFSAACTPDFFLFDSNKKLVYRGQLDDSRPNNSIIITGKDIRSAIDAILSDKPVDDSQRPSIGCNIKWKIGNKN
jgi:peroxiredoxin